VAPAQRRGGALDAARRWPACARRTCCAPARPVCVRGSGATDSARDCLCSQLALVPSWTCLLAGHTWACTCAQPGRGRARRRGRLEECLECLPSAGPASRAERPDGRTQTHTHRQTDRQTDRRTDGRTVLGTAPQVSLELSRATRGSKGWAILFILVFVFLSKSPKISQKLAIFPTFQISGRPNLQFGGSPKHRTTGPRQQSGAFGASASTRDEPVGGGVPVGEREQIMRRQVQAVVSHSR